MRSKPDEDEPGYAFGGVWIPSDIFTLFERKEISAIGFAVYAYVEASTESQSISWEENRKPQLFNLTNEQMAEWFRCSVKTIEREVKGLLKSGILKKKHTIKKGRRIRLLYPASEAFWMSFWAKRGRK